MKSKTAWIVGGVAVVAGLGFVLWWHHRKKVVAVPVAVPVATGAPAGVAVSAQLGGVGLSIDANAATS
jgi:uncharacterized iron-regulated membrane protein